MGSCTSKKSSRNHKPSVTYAINQLNTLSVKTVIFIAKNNPNFSFKMTIDKKEAETNNLDYLFAQARIYFQTKFNRPDLHMVSIRLLHQKIKNDNIAYNFDNLPVYFKVSSNENAGSMQINVRTLGGATIPIYVDGTDKIEEIKS